MTEIFEGFGAFCYPTITVCDSTAELSKSPDIKDGKFRRVIVLIHELPKFKVLVSDDGFIAPLINDKEKAREFLHIVFASALLHGFAWRQTFDADICNFSWEKDSMIIDIPSMRPTERNYIAFQRDNEVSLKTFKKFPRDLVKLDTMRFILNKSYEFSTNPQLSEDLVLLNEGWSLIYDEVFRAGFLYSWMLIESFLERAWYGYVDSLGISSDDKKNLKSHARWTAYHYIEVLFMLGKLTPETRKILHSYRKKRNDIIHDRIPVLKEEAVDCLQFALKIIINLLNVK